MGGILSRIINRVPTSYTRRKYIIVGLDAAGKTTFLYKLRLGEVVSMIPTIGMNFECVKINNLELLSWDFGGMSRHLHIWKDYFKNTSAIIFIVDSSDFERMEDTKSELYRLLGAEDLKGLPLLVYCNKIDLPMRQTEEQIVEKLGLAELKIAWKTQKLCAVSGEGINEGFEWLSGVLSNT